MRWRTLRAQLKTTRKRANALPAGDERDAVLRGLAEVAKRTAPPILRIAASENRGWAARSVVDHKDITVQPGENALAPGAYWLKSERIAIPFRIPLVVDAATPPIIDVSVDLPAGGLPADMVYVFAGPPAPGQPPVGPFLISEAEITCVDYAGYLDELEAEERDKRMPPEGFVADPNMPGRYVAAPEYEDRPVLGLTPEDAAAYAAWRAEIYSLEIRLPTKAEWQRAAGGAWLSPAGSAWFRPLMKDGDRVRPDMTPFGTLGLLTNPPELVAEGDGYAVIGEGTGLGLPPTAEALTRSRPVQATDRLTAGIRVVQILAREDDDAE